MRRFTLSFRCVPRLHSSLSLGSVAALVPSVAARYGSSSTESPTNPPAATNHTNGSSTAPLRRQNIGKTHPNLQQALMGFEKQAHDAMIKAGFSEGFTHLIQLRSSQINKCAFCVRHHTREAVKPVTEPSGGGESIDRIGVLPAWRETTNYFSDKERAALGLLEAITNVADGQVPDEVYVEATKVLSPEELSAVQWISVSINAWNRVGIICRYQVKP